MNRPNIKIELDPVDKVIEGIGVLGIFLLVALPAIYYAKLPDIIPIHFGLNGVPDGLGRKETIWILPVLGLILYLGMTKLSKYPHIFNYPGEITEDNAERLYRVATKTIRFLKTATVCIFSYITYATIQTALGRQSGLGINFFIPVLLAVVFVGFFLKKMMNYK